MASDTEDPSVDAFAYYLPQFYPMELNSRWWGEGFTEWVSVLRAHQGWRSPRGTTLTPGELGFYDLRDRATRSRQGELARDAGLAAFCIYHYWSAGERLLPEVEDAILTDGQPDFPFFLGWANHHWTLMWQGRGDVVTHEQRYDEHENDDHINWLLDVMQDPRYYKVDGAPVLLVYDPVSVPSHQTVFSRWRRLAADRGHGLVLLGATRGVPDTPPTAHGLDAWVQGTAHVFAAGGRWTRASEVLGPPDAWSPTPPAPRCVLVLRPVVSPVRKILHDFPQPTVPLVLTGWNNLGRRARKGSATNSTPDKFGRAIVRAAAKSPAVGSDAPRRLVAINAWNEWGEGMTLEPASSGDRATSTRWPAPSGDATRTEGNNAPRGCLTCHFAGIENRPPGLKFPEHRLRP